MGFISDAIAAPYYRGPRELSENRKNGSVFSARTIDEESNEYYLYAAKHSIHQKLPS